VAIGVAAQQRVQMVLRAWIEGADWVKGLATLIAALAAHFIDFEAHPEWLGFAKSARRAARLSPPSLAASARSPCARRALPAVAFAASAVLVALVLLFVYARLMLARDHARIKVTVNAGLPTWVARRCWRGAAPMRILTRDSRFAGAAR
jgi:hypothetical protein